MLARSEPKHVFSFHSLGINPILLKIHSIPVTGKQMTAPKQIRSVKLDKFFSFLLCCFDSSR